MTFLQLCQMLALEAGISGGIVTTAGQAGEAGRVVRWVSRAYAYVQNLHEDWKFLRRDVEFPVQLGLAKYTPDAAGVPLEEFGCWYMRDKWRSYLTASGYADEQEIDYVPYDKFRLVYGFGNSRLQPGRPTVMTVAPDQSLLFWPTPNDAYTIVGEQYHAPFIMTADGDVPAFAARFHNVIVYRALMLYGEFEGDPSVIGASQTETERELDAMESFYLPGMTMAGSGPLA